MGEATYIARVNKIKSLPTCFRANSKETHLAFEPQMIPSACCRPNLTIAG
jgi:hypothetical protein